MKNKISAHFLFVLLIIFGCVLSGTQCWADPTLIIDPDKQFNFAERYFSKKDYFRAISEYKRYLYFFPEGDKVQQAMVGIGMSYFESGRFDDAVAAFTEVLQKYPTTEFYLKSSLMISACYVKQNAFGPAILNLQNLITITDDMEIIDEANYRIGWIYIEMAEWEKARLYFGKISKNNTERYRLQKLMTDLDSAHSVKKKNPRTAGLLSLFPGAGYMYCERYQDALIAFLLNGGLILAAYESFDKGLNALGGVITFVEFGFYAGSIHGSIASAHKYNRSKINRFIETLKQYSTINLSSGIRENRILLTYQFHF